ncbi:MAG: tetratricopeptide repeat protein [Candidatus Daviesbacteria bacterium]|nr:tetratricopeptide repeat protein [Candidatus Daviesbacteria bacterium]
MVEYPKRPEIFNQRLEAARALQVAGGSENWNRAVSTCENLLDEFGLDPRVLNVMGVPLRMLNRQYEAIQAFSLAAAKTDDWEVRLTAISGLIDAWRTAGRDKTFPVPQYVKETEKTAYLHTSALFFIPIAESVMTDAMSNLGINSNLAYVEAYTQFGLLYNDMGMSPEALDAYTTAEDNARKLVTTDTDNGRYQNRLARVLHVKGVTQQTMGMIREARASQDEALPIFRKQGDMQNLCNVLASEGDLSEIESQLDTARTYWEEGLAIARTGNRLYIPHFEGRLARL